MIDNLKNIVREYICMCGPILDIGCGSGSSIRLISDSCGSGIYIVGIDLDFERLMRAKQLLGSYFVDFIHCDASMIPIRNTSIAAAAMVLTLHEVDERLADMVLDEVWRTLKPDGMLFFVEKFLFKTSKPSEKLTMLTEEAYHKAVEYVIGSRFWGLRKPEEYISKLIEHGFKLLVTDILHGKYIDGETFLSSWGRDTLRLLEQVGDEAKRKELAELVHRIRSLGSKYGYGPPKVLVAILSKEH